ncbi:MAG TPA: molybdopterin-dependent oxidoreductase [Bryobacteraceae bacterium]|nr:molybdopterin-dependent oxidoreductase [Bryobacteraceae bacterium]
MKSARRSVCALDCPDACSLLVTVEDGVATRLRGNPEHPVTRGFLCGKVARYLEREYSPARLLHPLRRVGAKGEGRFERVSWDAALDEIAGRLGSIAGEFGPESILPYSYAGTMGLLQGAGMDRRFFHRLGASRLDRTICSQAGGIALAETVGARYGTDMEQARHARLIIAWGANILGTNVHLWPFIVEARRNGAKFYTIDPVKNRTGQAADSHFFIHPGSDAALALGMMHVLIGEGLCDDDYVARYTNGFADLREHVRGYTPERAAALTGIAAEEIVALAREYANTKPSLIRLNYGVQRSERGAQAVRAISLLPALTGAWRDPAGGLLLTSSGAFQLNRAALERPDLQMNSPLGRPARLVNMTELGKVLAEPGEPPVKALVVYNSNPAAVAPNQNRVLKGLRREDLFTVVLEQFQTDTVDYADLVLPVTTFFEHTDLYYSYGHYYLQLARAALEAPGETRSNVAIFRELAARMGFEEDCFRDSDDDMIRSLLDTPHPFVRGITLEELERNGFVRLRVAPAGQPFVPFAQGGFGTPSGKCEIDVAGLAYEPPVESRLGDPELRARFPLELISPKADDGMNSTFGHRDAVDAAQSAATLHTRDAVARGIASGDRVRVFNARGSVTLVADVSDAVPEGVVRALSVRWARRSEGGRSVNALTSDRLTDAGGGPVFYSCLVQVERCGD